MVLTDKEAEEMLKDMEEADNFEFEEDEKFQDFLKTKKARQSEDETIREMAEEERLKGTHPELFVLIEGNEKYINYNKLAEKFNLRKYNGRLEIDHILRENARIYIYRYNNDVYSWGQKILRAKIKFVDDWHENVVKKEIQVD